MTLPEHDRQAGTLRVLAREYSSTRRGSWLNDLQWDGLPIVFHRPPLHRLIGVVYIPCAQDRVVLFSRYIYALRRLWHRHTHPWAYILGLVYTPLIDRDAMLEQLAAESWLRSRTEPLILPPGRRRHRDRL